LEHEQFASDRAIDHPSLDRNERLCSLSVNVDESASVQFIELLFREIDDLPEFCRDAF